MAAACGAGKCENEACVSVCVGVYVRVSCVKDRWSLSGVVPPSLPRRYAPSRAPTSYSWNLSKSFTCLSPPTFPSTPSSPFTSSPRSPVRNLHSIISSLKLADPLSSSHPLLFPLIPAARSLLTDFSLKRISLWLSFGAPCWPDT